MPVGFAEPDLVTVMTYTDTTDRRGAAYAVECGVIRHHCFAVQYAVGQTNTIDMRLSLPTTIIAIIVYESLLLGIRSRLMMASASALATTRQGDWIETVPVPLWWWALAIVPPVLLIGYWAFRRVR